MCKSQPSEGDGSSIFKVLETKSNQESLLVSSYFSSDANKVSSASRDSFEWDAKGSISLWVYADDVVLSLKYKDCEKDISRKSKQSQEVKHTRIYRHKIKRRVWLKIVCLDCVTGYLLTLCKSY